MKLNLLSFACLGFCAATLITVSSATAADAGFHLLREIPMREGVAWTAMVVDETGRRLYAAHGGRIEVVKLDSDSSVGAITDTPDVRGLALAPTFHMAFASSGKAQAISLIDVNNLHTTTKMKTGANPAAVVFEQSKLQLFAFNQGDGSATAGEADDGDFLATIDLGGKPAYAISDAAQYESKAAQVFCSLGEKNEIVDIDVGTHKVANRWPLAPGQSPGGMAYDAADHRLFVACANKLLLLVDSSNGKVVATVPMGDGAGDVAYDPAAQNVFAASADGIVTIAHLDAPDKLTVLQTLKTKPGSSKLGLDGRTHKIYVGSADVQGANPIPGASRILVYGM